MNESTARQEPDLRREAGIAIAYFALFMAYLFWRLEGEFLHWLSLVIIPLAVLSLYQRISLPSASFAVALASVGLRKGNLSRGLWWAMAVGLVLSVAQLWMSNRRDEILEILGSSKVFLLFPVTFLLMLFLAGTTEEFFFRGVLLTRLARWLKSDVWAIVLTAFLFGLYHLPYAYYNPQWPSHGRWGDALLSAFGQGGIGGVILGLVYVKSNKNLLACILTHALINTLPGMTMVHFGSK